MRSIAIYTARGALKRRVEQAWCLLVSYSTLGSEIEDKQNKSSGGLFVICVHYLLGPVLSTESRVQAWSLNLSLKEI